jgi:mannosyltransferase OCH1-like enzyme
MDYKIVFFFFILLIIIILYYNKNELKIHNLYRRIFEMGHTFWVSLQIVGDIRPSKDSNVPFEFFKGLKFNTQIIFLIFVLLSSLLFWMYQKKKEGMNIYIDNTPEYDLDTLIDNAVIPLDIYQTWSTKELPPKMRECVEKLKKKNPEFNYYLYDDSDCRNFIKNNYSNEILNAYDNLIPPAYKADLWRYCILYKNGGIYLDIKFQCEPGFKLIELVDKEYFVLDRPYSNSIDLNKEIELVNDRNYYNNILKFTDSIFWKENEIGIYNAVMVCKPQNPVLLECIKAIVNNVKNKYYGYNPLYPTGPGLLGEIFINGDTEKINKFELFNSLIGTYILSKKKKILSHYPEYRQEQQVYGKKILYYHNLWNKKNIYADNSSIFS